MALRRPFVLINNRLQQLPVGDDLTMHKPIINNNGQLQQLDSFLDYQYSDSLLRPFVLNNGNSVLSERLDEEFLVGDGYELYDINGEDFIGAGVGLANASVITPDQWSLEPGTGTDPDFYVNASGNLVFQRNSAGSGRNLYYEHPLDNVGDLYISDWFLNDISSTTLFTITPSGQSSIVNNHNTRTRLLGQTGETFSLSTVCRTAGEIQRFGFRPADSTTQQETLKWARFKKIPNILEGLVDWYDWSANLTTTPGALPASTGWTATSGTPLFSYNPTYNHLIFDRNGASNLDAWMETTISGLVSGRRYRFAVACGDHNASQDLNLEMISGANTDSAITQEDGYHVNLGIEADGSSVTLRMRPRGTNMECAIKHVALICTSDPRLEFDSSTIGAPFDET